jgi:hypothetical protein
MTPEEIRALNPSMSTMFDLVREIAAQLAESGERQSVEYEDVQMFRNRSLAQTELITDLQKQLVKPPAPALTIPSPVDIPTHLGCLLLMPNGGYGITTENGIVELEPEEGRRLIALLQKPAQESKPQ